MSVYTLACLPVQALLMSILEQLVSAVTDACTQYDVVNKAASQLDNGGGELCSRLASSHLASSLACSTKQDSQVSQLARQQFVSNFKFAKIIVYCRLLRSTLSTYEDIPKELYYTGYLFFQLVSLTGQCFVEYPKSDVLLITCHGFLGQSSVMCQFFSFSLSITVNCQYCDKQVACNDRGWQKLKYGMYRYKKF